MDYAAHYSSLISRARNRELQGYFERHHTIPKCLGGSDDHFNIVSLTPEEHYVAHQLLVKMHPGVHGLVYATIMMAARCSGNKAYGWLRRKASGFTKSPEVRAKISAAIRAAWKRPDAAKNMVAARKGRPLTQEWKAKISAAGMGRVQTAETRRKLSLAKAGLPGRPQSEETKRKRSLAMKGKMHGVANLLKMSVARRGEKRGSPSAATRAKQSAAMKGRAQSPEHRENHRKALAAMVLTPERSARLSAAKKADWQRRKLKKLSMLVPLFADPQTALPVDVVAPSVGQSAPVSPRQSSTPIVQPSLFAN